MVSDVPNVVSGTGERRVQQGRLDPPIRDTQPRAAAGAKRRLHSGRERGDAELEPLPIILGAELPGIAEAIGSEVLGFNVGDEVYGATNQQFSGAYAEYVLALARMMARKPRTLNFIEAGAASVVTVTAWQMLFEYAQVIAGQTVLIHGATGNVGACDV